MYFTDRGIEELEKRRGDEEVSLAWLAEQLPCPPPGWCRRPPPPPPGAGAPPRLDCTVSLPISVDERWSVS